MKARIVSTALSIWLAAGLAPPTMAVGDPNVDSGVGSSSSRGVFGFSNSNYLQQQTTPPNSYGVYRDVYGALRDTGMIPDNLTVRADEMIPEQHIQGQTPMIPGLGAVGGIGSGGFGGFPFGGGFAGGLPASFNPTGLPLSQPLNRGPSFVRGFGSIPGYRGGFVPASPFGPATVSRGVNGSFQPLAPSRTSTTQSQTTVGPDGNSTSSTTTGPGFESSQSNQQTTTSADGTVIQSQDGSGFNDQQTTTTSTAPPSSDSTTATTSSNSSTTTTTTFGDQRGFTMTAEEQPQGNFGSMQGSRRPEPVFGVAQDSTTGGSSGTSQGTRGTGAPVGSTRGVIGAFGPSQGQRITPVDTATLFSPFANFPFSPISPFPPAPFPPFFGGGGAFASSVINPNILLQMDERDQDNGGNGGNRSTGELAARGERVGGASSIAAPQITTGNVRVGRPGTSSGVSMGASGVSELTTFGATGATSTGIGNNAKGTATTFGPTGSTSVTFGGPTVVTSNTPTGSLTTVFGVPGASSATPYDPFSSTAFGAFGNGPVRPGIIPSIGVRPLKPYVGSGSVGGDGLQMDASTETDLRLKAQQYTPLQMLGTILGHMRYANGDIVTFGSRGTMRLATDNSASITLNSGEVVTFRRAGEDLRRVAYRSLFLF